MIQYLKKGYVMKKIKYLILIIVVLVSTGCFKRDNMEGIKIVTLVYPIEYVTSYLYKDHATISSIYPDGVDIAQFGTAHITDEATKNFVLMLTPPKVTKLSHCRKLNLPR